jgi:ABC-2 type transport system permease protein
MGLHERRAKEEIMGHRVRSMIRKEFIQIRRDRRTLAMIIVIPLIWLVAFGYAVTFDVTHVPTAIVDRAHNEASQALVAGFRGSDHFTVTDINATSDAGVREAIKAGTVAAVIVIPAGYGDAGAEAPVRILTDGSDLFSSQSVLRVAPGIIQAATLAHLRQTAGPLGGAMPALAGVAPAVDILYNPQLKSSYVMVPGLMGLVMVFIATLMTALGVVRERERGTLEQLIVTPIRPLELMVGKVTPYVLISVLDFVLVLVVGLGLFAVPLRGSFLLLSMASLFFLLGALGVGLLVSTVSQNQQQAMQLAIFTLFPQFIFSGFIFPLAAMPWGVRWISYLMPLTYFVPVTRGVFLKAEAWAGLWPNVLILAIYGIGVLVLAATRFQKRLA